MCHLNVSKYTVEPKMPNESAGREARHTGGGECYVDVHCTVTALLRGPGLPSTRGREGGDRDQEPGSCVGQWGITRTIGWEHSGQNIYTK